MGGLWRSDTELTIKSAHDFCIDIKHCDVYYANVPGKHFSYCNAELKEGYSFAPQSTKIGRNVQNWPDITTGHFMQSSTTEATTTALTWPHSWNNTSLTQSHKILNTAAFIKVKFYWIAWTQVFLLSTMTSRSCPPAEQACSVCSIFQQRDSQ